MIKGLFFAFATGLAMGAAVRLVEFIGDVLEDRNTSLLVFDSPHGANIRRPRHDRGSRQQRSRQKGWKRMNRQFFRELLVIIGVLLIAFAIAKAHAADLDDYQPPPVYSPIAPVPYGVAPIAPIYGMQPRCRVVRETKHDDILDSNDYVELEDCGDE